MFKCLRPAPECGAFGDVLLTPRLSDTLRDYSELLLLEELSSSKLAMRFI